MGAAHDIAGFHAALVFLGAAALVIPLFHRLRVSPVVGYILVGVIFGPTGLGLVEDMEGINWLAELGILLLMWLILR